MFEIAEKHEKFRKIGENFSFTNLKIVLVTSIADEIQHLLTVWFFEYVWTKS